MTGLRRTALLAAAALAIAAPSSAASQQWALEARVGRLDFGLSPTPAPAATSVAVGLGFESFERRLRLSAGIPTGENEPLWTSLEAATRPTTRWGPAEVGADLAASGFLQRYEVVTDGPGGPLGGLTGGEVIWGNGLAAQALPLAALTVGPAELRVRGGVSYYRATLGDADTTRIVPLADARLSVRPMRSLVLSADVRRFGGDAGPATYAGGAVVLALPELSLWGSAGRWIADGDPDPEWSVGGVLPLAERLDLTVQARQQTLDPLYGSSPRRAWDLGLRFGLTELPSAAAPVPADYSGGRALIALDTRHAERTPSIAGDFNDWTPAPMRREGDRWVHTVALEPGVYEYAFIDAAGEWFVPEGTPGRKDDGMGGHVALLIVREGES